MSGPAISDEVYAAAGLALVPFGDDANLFEWHHCIDQPACRGATGPCPCSGMPWPSEAVRAAITAALVASGWRPEADVLREAAEEIRGADSFNYDDEDPEDWQAIVAAHLEMRADIRERYPATALELERPGPGEAMTCPTCNRTIGVTRHGRLASHYKPSTLARCEGDDRD